jgi:hypothetical protein
MKVAFDRASWCTDRGAEPGVPRVGNLDKAERSFFSFQQVGGGHTMTIVMREALAGAG